MRIWDIPIDYLCTQHLVAEHRELHVLWGVLQRGSDSGGWRHHPETVRWRTSLAQLWLRHEQQHAELRRRNPDSRYSPLLGDFEEGGPQLLFVHPPEYQVYNLYSWKSQIRPRCRCSQTLHHPVTQGGYSSLLETCYSLYGRNSQPLRLYAGSLQFKPFTRDQAVLESLSIASAKKESFRDLSQYDLELHCTVQV